MKREKNGTLVALPNATDLEIAERIVGLAERLLIAQAERKAKQDEENQKVKDAKASFKESVEQGHDGKPDAMMMKLNVVEASWQDWQETEQGRVEVRKEEGEKVSTILADLRQALEDRNQTAFDFE